MLLSPTPSAVPEHKALRRGELWSVRTRAGLRVRCLSGSVWITRGRDDVVLGPGDTSLFYGPHATVVQALSAAEVAVERVGA